MPTDLFNRALALIGESPRPQGFSADSPEIQAILHGNSPGGLPLSTIPQAVRDYVDGATEPLTSFEIEALENAVAQWAEISLPLIVIYEPIDRSFCIYRDV